MSTIKRIVCLANSRMDGGRCVAGKELTGGVPRRWIRPVGKGTNKAVPIREDLKLLDIIEVSLSEPAPNLHQQENWLLDSSPFPLSRHGRWSDPKQLLDPVKPLWIDERCTSNNKNDRVLRPSENRADSSLRFIQIDRLLLSVFEPGEFFDNTYVRVRGCFRHDGAEYNLWVTDPDCECEYSTKSSGDYEIGESFLTVSLPDKTSSHTDAYHKLIAAIIPCGGKDAT